jgi:lipid-A-disaccharide synthase
MKRIFILTGEPSGDKLASKVIFRLKKLNNNIEYLSVGGDYLKALKINSIYDLKDITYLGFTKVLINLFKIKKKINETANKIIEFNPDILFSVDSPDFTLRVSKLVKKRMPSINTIHYVAPQVWLWREGRVKKIKKFIDHILLLFNFEKKYFDKENVNSTFVGHPLLEKEDKGKISIKNFIPDNKKIISLFPGSRFSELKKLMPILIKFIKLTNTSHNNFFFIFHVTKEFKDFIKKLINDSNIENCEIVSDELIKNDVLKKSIFAIAKSGTVSLEICNARIPSLIIYKMNFINFFIIKLLVKVKYANIVNILSNSEVIPELLQSKCNEKNIYKIFVSYINDPSLAQKQVDNYNKVLKELYLNDKPSEKAALILNNSLKAFNS